MTTFKDVIDQLYDFLGSNPEQKAARDAKRAILEAYRDIANAHRWSYYYAQGRISSSASYATGTVEFDLTGGTYERMLTLTSGTWPTWALYGVVRIGNVDYEVAERKSGTVLTLATNSNPGADVAAGTTYLIFRDGYTLPSDFVAMDKMLSEGNRLYLDFVHPRNWLASKRYALGSFAIPTLYSVIGDDNLYGRLAVVFWPYPASAETFDFIYQRRGRALAISEYKTGTVSTTAAAATITGVGTAFTADMVGSVIRVSANSADDAGPAWGNKPFAEERIVLGYTSATVLTADTAFSNTASGVKYNISDPVDVEEGAMLNAFLRGCELRLATNRLMPIANQAAGVYRDTLKMAKEADSRSFAVRIAGGGKVGGLGLGDYAMS